MAYPFQTVNIGNLEFFASMLGEEAVLTGDESLQSYARDYTEDLFFPPNGVLLPNTAEEVAAILAYCHEHNIAVTPRGAGTGLSGGSFPVCGGISLPLARLIPKRLAATSPDSGLSTARNRASASAKASAIFLESSTEPSFTIITSKLPRLCAAMDYRHSCSQGAALR